MNSSIRWLVIGLTLCSAALEAQAGVSIGKFQANGMYVTQESGGNSYSPQLSWNPTVPLSKVLYLRANLAGAYLKSTTDKGFFGTTYQLLLGFNPFLANLGLELGAGMQTWWERGGTHMIASANLPWKLSQPMFGMVDRIFVGVSRYELSSDQISNNTMEYKLGFGISL